MDYNDNDSFVIYNKPVGPSLKSNFNPNNYYRGNGGYLLWISGPMFSGKSLELIRHVRRFKVAKNRILVLKHSLDGGNRFDMNTNSNTNVISRDGITESCILLNTMASTCTLDVLNEYDGVAIDEAQFFPDLRACIAYWLNAGKIVITAGLDGNFLAEPFGEYIQLVPWATEIIKCKAVCVKCSAMDATFSYRLTDNKNEIETGDGNYEARCYRCFENHN